MSLANQNTALRTDFCWNRYQHAPKPEQCIFCTKNGRIVQIYDHWYIMKNAFPYDAVAAEHDMLIPYDHYQDEEQLPGEALEELGMIWERLERDAHYDCIMRNFRVAQSVPTHLHYHLLKWKRT